MTKNVMKLFDNPNQNRQTSNRLQMVSTVGKVMNKKREISLRFNSGKRLLKKKQPIKYFF